MAPGLALNRGRPRAATLRVAMLDECVRAWPDVWVPNAVQPPLDGVV
ncbi:MAG: hypothetical protein AAGA32_00985 [Pseudomonadota bacterium]